MRAYAEQRRPFALVLTSVAIIVIPVLLTQFLLTQNAGAATPSLRQVQKTWQVQKTQNPRLKVEQFYGVSCTSTSYCVAVGNRLNDVGAVVTLAEQWNGSTWQMMSTSSPKGALDPVLTGVSCSSLPTVLPWDPTTAVQAFLTRSQRHGTGRRGPSTLFLSILSAVASKVCRARLRTSAWPSGIASV